MGEGERAGWLSRMAPGIRRRFGKPKTPENLWIRCPDTDEMIYRPHVEAALWVTPYGRHMRIGAELRLRYTFDGGRYEPIAAPETPDDPLGFFGDRPYIEQLEAARATHGRRDAMLIGAGEIDGQPTVMAVQDFAFLGGSLGTAVGESFVTAAHAAIAREVPFVVAVATGGARMQEGTLSLMQMARTTLALNEVKAAGLPYVVLLTDPTTAGVMASYAMLGDLHIAEPQALIGFTGRRVIEQTIRETLPESFQKAEFLQDRGMVDQIVPRAEIPKVLGSYLRLRMDARRRAA